MGVYARAEVRVSGVGQGKGVYVRVRLGDGCIC